MPIWTTITEALSQLGDSISSYFAGLVNSTPSTPEKSVAFTIGMIALGAKMAKADGRVTPDEVNAFKQVFHIPSDSMKHVARVFDLAKQDIAGFDSYAKQMAKLFGLRAAVLQDVLDALFHIAKADHTVHDKELAYLESVAGHFGFSGHDFEAVKARHVISAEATPYDILGVSRSDSIDVIKSKYRQLVREYHPDRHIAEGMPAELIELATGRLAKINAAYEAIVKERGV